jgi:FkbM family methyltransferase
VGAVNQRLRAFVSSHPRLRGPAVRARRLAWRLSGRTVPAGTGAGVPWGRLGERERSFDLVLPTSPEGVRPLARARLVAPERCLVPRHLQQGGLAGFELDSVSTFLGLCSVVEHGTVLDIGANTGHYAFLASVYFDREVIAFEPVPELAGVARSLGRTNGFAFPVEELALSDEPGEATFYLSDKSDSSSSLRQGFRPSTHQLTVRKETLDGYVQRQAISPSILKIDTETTEPDVLRGGLQTLGEHRPWMICEVLPGRSDAQIEGLLRPLDYRFYKLSDHVPYTLEERLVGDPGQYNWLFAPSEAPPALWDAIRAWRAALRSTPA